METCLFCENGDAFNINDGEHKAKEAIIEFFGYTIEEDLRNDDSICNTCLKLMELLAKLKRALLVRIIRSVGEAFRVIKPINFGKVLHVFTEVNLNLSDEDLEDNGSYEDTMYPTPGDFCDVQKQTLLVPSKDGANRSRSDSVTSKDSNEVAKAFEKKRGKKRGNGWTRPKRRSSSLWSQKRSKSTTSSVRSQSRLSTITTALTASPGVGLRFKHNGVEEFRYYVHECDEPHCAFTCQNVNYMLDHMAQKHNKVMVLLCDICNEKFSSGSSFEKHRQTHTKNYMCVICYKEFYLEEGLQLHWDEHFKKSVCCRDCGKRFVNRTVRDKHRENAHKPESEITKRTDYEKDYGSVNGDTNLEYEVNDEEIFDEEERFLY